MNGVTTGPGGVMYREVTMIDARRQLLLPVVLPQKLMLPDGFTSMLPSHVEAERIRVVVVIGMSDPAAPGRRAGRPPQ
jgi:hypothetical protein